MLSDTLSTFASVTVTENNIKSTQLILCGNSCTLVMETTKYGPSHILSGCVRLALRLEKDLLTFCSFCHQTVIVRPENLSHIVDVR